MTTLNVGPHVPLERRRVHPSNASETLPVFMAPLRLARRL
jgi:hypothetical protein